MVCFAWKAILLEKVWVVLYCKKQGNEWVVIGYHTKRLPQSAKNFGVTELELTRLLVNIQSAKNFGVTELESTGLLVNIHGFYAIIMQEVF